MVPHTAGERPSCSGEKGEKPSSHGDSVAYPRAVILELWGH